jgi:hypothetical protein
MNRINQPHASTTPELIKQVKQLGMIQRDKYPVQFYGKTLQKQIRIDEVTMQFCMVHEWDIYFIRPMYIGSEPQIDLAWTVAE